MTTSKLQLLLYWSHDDKRKPIQVHVHVRARFTGHPRSRAGNDVATARSHIAPGNETSGYFFLIGDSENCYDHF